MVHTEGLGQGGVWHVVVISKPHTVDECSKNVVWDLEALLHASTGREGAAIQQMACLTKRCDTV